jgi:filamentous hemagglutinin
MLAGIMLPGKKLPNAGTTIVSDSVAFSTKQLDKKFKHASDFGVVTTKKMVIPSLNTKLLSNHI